MQPPAAVRPAPAAQRSCVGGAGRRGRCHRGRPRGGPGGVAAALAAFPPNAPRSWWSPPRAWTPSGWATISPVSFAAEGDDTPEAGPSSACWAGRSLFCRPGRPSRSSGSVPRPRRWGADWPCSTRSTGAPDRAPAAAPGDRGAGPGDPAALGPARRPGADRHPPGPAGRRRDLLRRAGRQGLPTRAPGGAPWGVGRARRHRRRVPLDGGRPGAHRPLGRRGGSPHRVLRQRPAVVARPGRGGALRVPRARPHPVIARRGAALVARRPWGASVWERLAGGEQFDGMESGYPSSTASARVLPDLLGPAAQVVLVEPRRIRDRGRPAARRGGRTGRDAGGHLGAERKRRRASRACTSRSSGCSATPRPGSPPCRPCPRAPQPHAHRAPLRPGGGGPGAAGGRGDGSRRPGATRSRSARPRRRGRAGSRRRWRRRAFTRPSSRTRPARREPAWSRLRSPAGSSFPRPRWRCCRRPTSPGGGSRTGGRGPWARAADGFFDDLEAGSFVVHRQHGVARFEGVTTRTMGGTTRDYLILQYRGLGPPLPAGRAD